MGKRRVRCAIYVRKSTEDGLDQDFNSLDAQTEACAAYITSQKNEGWVALREIYSDGGISGGTLERPALKRLMADVDDGLVDQIVVYKIDRLTRSLPDFAKLVDRLDAAEASFVSVTQSFNTSTSMGRLTLNVLLSFAQFEREVTAERIRDKIAASKKKGLWMGGQVPLGYRSEGRTLIIHNEQAKIIRRIFDHYQKHQNIRLVRDALREDTSICARTRAFSRGHLQFILSNPVYAGRIRHKKLTYEGLHEPIIDPERWQQIQTLLTQTASKPRGHVKRVTSTSFLTGKLYDEAGDRLTPTHANSKGRRYRYYVSHRLIRDTADKIGKDDGHGSGFRIPAENFERHLDQTVLRHLTSQASVKSLPTSSVHEIQLRKKIIDDLEHSQSGNKALPLLHLIDRTTLAEKTMEIRLIAQELATLLKIPVSTIPENLLNFTIPANMKKRGIETKFVFDDGNAQRVDETLLKNIANANNYYDAIKNGETIEQIAIRENVTGARILKRLELAFLSPAITRTVIEGTQPIGLTTKWFQNRTLPLDWSAQAELINQL